MRYNFKKTTFWHWGAQNWNMLSVLVAIKLLLTRYFF